MGIFIPHSINLPYLARVELSEGDGAAPPANNSIDDVEMEEGKSSGDEYKFEDDDSESSENKEDKKEEKKKKQKKKKHSKTSEITIIEDN